ncbi:MAG: YfhO family protein [Acidobacteriota bacterium]
MAAHDLGYLTAILLFFLIFFWRIPLRGDLPLIGDPLAYSYPMRVVAWDMIRSGTLPLWTPYIFSGYPLLSMAQLGLGYPATWPYLFLPGQWAETIYVIIPFLLAPAFLYAYLRTLGRSRIASLLGGLSFGYGGMMASKLSNGMLPNAVMWLPLILIAIERGRRGRFLPWLVVGGLAYSMSVLTGIGQGFVFTGLIAGAYALFVSVADFPERRWRALRPVGIAVGAALLATGVAAFQIFESWTAVRLSVRSELTYEIFGQLSLPIWQAWAALWIPLFYHIESAPYLAPVVLGLAIAGVVGAVKRPRLNQQAFFWIALALISAVLIAGIYTPAYRVLYHIPILNKFRGGSRHTFGWTLSLSILGAYGWDTLTTIRLRLGAPRRRRLILVGLYTSGLLSGGAGVIWWRDIATRVPINTEIALSAAGRTYFLFKLGFVALTAILLWCAWRLEASRFRSVAVVVCLSWMCFLEASFFMQFAWAYPAVPSKWFDQIKRPTKFLQDQTSNLERVYLRVVGFDVRDLEERNLDFLNLAARHKIQNIAGYEPLILERYSRALGDVWLDGVRRKLATRADFSLFDPRSRVLDLLNTTLVAGYSNLQVNLPYTIEKEGVRFSSNDFNPEAELRLGAIAAEGDTLALVTNMSHSAFVDDGTPVARLTIRSLDGTTIERDVLAGRDTAEWAHERPDVRRTIRHKLAPVFDRYPGDRRDSFPAYRYWSRIPFGKGVLLERIEIKPLIPSVPVVVAKATLIDEARRLSTPLVQLVNETGPSEFIWLSDRSRWEKVYDRDEVLIVKNQRAMPRVWLAGSIEVVPEDEALRRIQGRGAAPFDPATTALFEIAPPNVERYSGKVPGNATARVTRFEANSLAIETTSANASVLVTSEINYPGWEATVDGEQTPIYAADYLLRAVPLAPGNHRVEMRYRAPGARRGAIISICTLLIIGCMAVYCMSTRREKKSL